MELRDKLFTEEQYIKQLAKYYCRIEKLNSMIELILNVEYIKSLLTAEIYNYCLQEYMCRLINENVSEQEQLSL